MVCVHSCQSLCRGIFAFRVQDEEKHEGVENEAVEQVALWGYNPV